MVKKSLVFALLALSAAATLFAQTGEKQRPAPNYDDLVSYLKLTDAQVTCLETNKTKYQEAAAPSMEQLRNLLKQLRQAARAGSDTTAIQSQITSLRTSMQTTRNSYTLSAQSCVGGAAAVKDLIAAEALMNEVRQGVGLLLVPPTEIGPGMGDRGFGGGRRGFRGKPKDQ